MQQGIKKTLNLQNLLLDLTELSDSETEKLGRQIFFEFYLDNVRRGVRNAHDGEQIYFWERQFNHSCFISPKKEVIDKNRVARLKWILPLVQGKVPNSECWLIKNGYRPDNRLYMWLPANFVVWLESRDDGGWKFYTLYTANRMQVRGYQRNGKRIWCFGK